MFAYLQSSGFTLALMAIVVFGILGFFTVVFTGIYFVKRRGERKEGVAWAETARALGLQLHGSVAAPSTADVMLGRFAGREVAVSVRERWSSEHSVLHSTRVQKKRLSTWCEAKYAPPPGLEFRIFRKNGGERRGIGHVAFDQIFMVLTDDLPAVSRILLKPAHDDRSAAERFSANAVHHWTIECTSSNVTIKMPALVTAQEQLGFALETVVELATRLDHGAQGSVVSRHI